MSSIGDFISGDKSEVVSPTVETVTLDSSGQLGFKFDKGHSKKGSDASDFSTKSDSPNPVKRDGFDMSQEQRRLSDDLAGPDENKFDPFADGTIFMSPGKALSDSSLELSPEYVNVNETDEKKGSDPFSSSPNLEKPSPKKDQIAEVSNGNLLEFSPEKPETKADIEPAKSGSSFTDAFSDFESPPTSVNPSPFKNSLGSNTEKPIFSPLELVSKSSDFLPSNQSVVEPVSQSIKFDGVDPTVDPVASVEASGKQVLPGIDKAARHSRTDDESANFPGKMAERYDELITENKTKDNVKMPMTQDSQEKEHSMDQPKEEEQKPTMLKDTEDSVSATKPSDTIKSQPADTTTPEKPRKVEKEDLTKEETKAEKEEKPKTEIKTVYVSPVSPTSIQKGDYAVDPMAILIPGTWFNPRNLHPVVADLVYWRDPKISGAVFASGLIFLFALAKFSFISVFAHILLVVLAGTVSFRVYKSILSTVQKTGDGHPLKDVLDADLNITTEKAHQSADLAVQKINATTQYLRHVICVEDYFDSLKFGLAMWLLTYVGSWFNGLSLIIIAYVAVFTLPKVYETNQTMIDGHLQTVTSKVNEIVAKVRAAIPIGKKKEQ